MNGGEREEFRESSGLSFDSIWEVRLKLHFVVKGGEGIDITLSLAKRSLVRLRRKSKGEGKGGRTITGRSSRVASLISTLIREVEDMIAFDVEGEERDCTQIARGRKVEREFRTS